MDAFYPVVGLIFFALAVFIVERTFARVKP